MPKEIRGLADILSMTPGVFLMQWPLFFTKRPASVNGVSCGDEVERGSNWAVGSQQIVPSPVPGRPSTARDLSRSAAHFV